uniref:Ribosomal protein S2 n=1 Tax=Pteridomonas sp. YPF1301 TaxID=2766739 RepID=A0A7G1MRS9_9STRA|nr:ribosomal protein S2 [Pteridomonas sp. YPF1301]
MKFVKKLLHSGVSYGHQKHLVNKKMFPYISFEKKGIHFINLFKTIKKLNEACIFILEKVKNKQNILFIGTTPGISEVIQTVAQKCRSCYVNYKWLGGLLTNWSTMHVQIKKFKLLKKNFYLNLKKYTKQKRIKLENYINKLYLKFMGILNMQKLPDVVIIAGYNNELTSIYEAKRKKIPIISIMDTNCDPTLIDIVIPGNDDLPSSVKLILSQLSMTILKHVLPKF